MTGAGSVTGRVMRRAAMSNTGSSPSGAKAAVMLARQWPPAQVRDVEGQGSVRHSVLLDAEDRMGMLRRDGGVKARKSMKGGFAPSWPAAHSPASPWARRSKLGPCTGRPPRRRSPPAYFRLDERGRIFPFRRRVIARIAERR